MIAQVLLIAFAGAAAVLWVSVFGYLLALAAVAWTRRRAIACERELPPIAVLVPVRNEAAFIRAKLADLERADYRRDRMRVLVVDGGSTDGTAELVEAERARGRALELVRVEAARGKGDQLNHALRLVHEDIVIVTDADSRLDPACMRELVGVLAGDPTTAVVGARVRPASGLLEERIHWWFLNYLWWLEGESLSSAVVSGVCYAFRRTAVTPLPADARADDVRLAMTASARGGRARLCRAAQATELRVPQTVREFLRFRRRRGAGYAQELLRTAPPAGAPLGWRWVRGVRLFHFFVTPRIAAGAGLVALALCFTPHWHWPVLAGAAFAAPVLLALGASTTLRGDRGGWWRLGLAAGRLLGLTWLSLLAAARLAYEPAAGDC